MAIRVGFLFYCIFAITAIKAGAEDDAIGRSCGVESLQKIDIMGVYPGDNCLSDVYRLAESVVCSRDSEGYLQYPYAVGMIGKQDILLEDIKNRLLSDAFGKSSYYYIGRLLSGLAFSKDRAPHHDSLFKELYTLAAEKHPANDEVPDFIYSFFEDWDDLNRIFHILKVLGERKLSIINFSITYNGELVEFKDCFPLEFCALLHNESYPLIGNFIIPVFGSKRLSVEFTNNLGGQFSMYQLGNKAVYQLVYRDGPYINNVRAHVVNTHLLPLIKKLTNDSLASPNEKSNGQ